MSSLTNSSRDTVAALIDRHLDDPTTSWGVSAFGAVGEFHWDAGEPGCERIAPLGRRSPRGSLEITPRDDVDVVAWERPYFHGAPWQQGALFVMPEHAARMGARTALTRLDDTEHGTLYDLGLGLPNVDVCVAVDDASLRAVLDAEIGASIRAGRAMAAIKEASPVRVFRSAFATCAVFQAIASSARGVPTPVGPHTHLRLSLLDPPRSHDAALPVPAGHLPVLEMFPAHPVRDALGEPRPFDEAAFDAFGALVDEHGPPGHADDKRRVRAAVAGEASIDPADPPRRQTARVALCQLRARGADEAAIERVARACGLDPAQLEIDERGEGHDVGLHHGRPHRH